MAGKKTPIAETFVSVVPETSSIAPSVEKAFRGTDAEARSAARRWRREIEDELKKIDALKVDADTDPAERKINELAAKSKREKIKLPVDVDKDDLKRVASTIAKTLGGAAAGALGTQAIVGGAGGIVALAGALLPAVGALGLIPAAAAAAGLAIGTLKIATSGFGEAIKAGAAGDPKAYAEAIAKLAPNAQQAALAIGALKPATDALKASLGNKFFDGLSGQIEKLGGTYLPILEGAMGKMASSANVALRQVGDMLQTPKAVADVTSLTGNASTAFGTLVSSLKPLSAAFLDLATVGGTFLPQLADGAKRAADSFAAFISNARDTGKLHDWIQGGLDVLRQIGAVAKNVGGILGGIFKAGQAEGAGMLNNLVAITGRIDDLVNSTEGQTALTTFFDSARDALGNVLPIFDTILTSIVGTIAPAFLDLATAIGPGLQAAFTTLAEVMKTLAPVLVSLGGPINELLDGLGPALQESVTALAPALLPIADAFVAIVNAVLPLAPVLSGLIADFGTGLAGAVSGLAGVLAPIAGFFHDNAVAGDILKGVLVALAAAWVVLKAEMVISGLVASVTSGFAAIGISAAGAGAGFTGVGAAATAASGVVAGAVTSMVAAAAALPAMVAGFLYTAQSIYDAAPTEDKLRTGGVSEGSLANARTGGRGTSLADAARRAQPTAPAPTVSVDTLGRLHGDGEGNTWKRRAPAPGSLGAIPTVAMPSDWVSGASNSSYALPQAPATSGGGGGGGALPASSSSSYGLPVGTTISAGGSGFPQWVYDVAAQFNLKPSTYAGHQEGSGSNKGIDWTGTPEDMRAFAEYLAAQGGMEQVIFQDPRDGTKIGVANGQRVGPGTSQPGYYAKDFGGHQNHVHTRQSSAIGEAGGASPMATPYDTGTGGSTDKQLRDAAQKVDDTADTVRSKQMALDELNAKGTATAKQRADAETALAKAKREHADAIEDLNTAQNKPVKGGKGAGGDDLGSIFGSGLAEMLGLDGSLFKSPGDLGIVKLFESSMKVGPKSGGGDGSVLPAGGGGGGGLLGALGALGSQPFGDIGGTPSNPGAAFATPAGGSVVDMAQGFLPPGGGIAGPGNGPVDQSNTTIITGNQIGPSVPEMASHLSGEQLATARPALRPIS